MQGDRQKEQGRGFMVVRSCGERDLPHLGSTKHQRAAARSGLHGPLFSTCTFPVLGFSLLHPGLSGISAPEQKMTHRL